MMKYIHCSTEYSVSYQSNNITKKVLILALLISISLTGHSFGFGWTQPNPGPSPNALAKEIKEILNGRVIGFAYAIAKGGNLAVSEGVGWARKPSDGGVTMTPETRMMVMSVSKTVTAVAVLQLLEKLNLSVHDHIGPWLPSDWVRGPGFENTEGLTFRDLLTHNTGIQDTIALVNEHYGLFVDLDRNSWDGLKTLVQLGVLPQFASKNGEYYGTEGYNNPNYSLLRIILPELWRAADSHIAAGAVMTDELSSFLFGSYVIQYVFEPAGIHGAQCFSTAKDKRPMYYDARYRYAPGWESGTSNDCRFLLGAKGWYLSAIDLAKLMVHMRYAEMIFANYPDNPEKVILSADNRETMDNEMLGWQARSGDIWGHSGWGISSAQAAAVIQFNPYKMQVVGARRELHACVMKFPSDLEATLVINSNISAIPWGKANGETNALYGNACTVLMNSFEQIQT